MVNDQKKLNKILSLISDNDYSKDLILMGSWNEYFYERIYDDFKSYMATQDLDFYCINRNKEKTDKDLYSLLIENGYICLHDTFTSKTTFVDNDFEIEFLHRNTRELKSTKKINRLGVVAECLNGLDSIEKFYSTYHDDTYGYDVNILNPSYYCIQKIVINSDRKEDKQVKDQISINNLLELIINNKDLKNDFITAYDYLTKKQHSKFAQNIKTLNLSEQMNKILPLKITKTQSNVVSLDKKQPLDLKTYKQKAKEYNDSRSSHKGNDSLEL